MLLFQMVNKNYQYGISIAHVRGMGIRKKIVFILPLLLMFLGYCGDNQEKKSASWLTTDANTVQGLNVPAALHAACQSSGHILVTWDPFTTTATNLVVERKSATEEYAKVGEINLESSNFSDSVTNGIDYTYRVRAIIMSGPAIQYVSEDYSIEATGRAASPCPVPIDVPVA